MFDSDSGSEFKGYDVADWRTGPGISKDMVQQGEVIMPALNKCGEETYARAVRMYGHRLAEVGTSQRAARVEVGELVGINSNVD